MSCFDFGAMLAFKGQMQQMEGELGGFMEQFLLEQGLAVLAKAKANTPPEQALLNSAWSTAENGVKRTGSRLTVTLVNSEKDASFVEYGHLSNERRQWCEGKFMATLAVDEAARTMPQKFAAEFVRWVRGLD